MVRPPAFRTVMLYGALLAAGVLALQWLDYQRLARTQMGDFAIGLVAAGFLALGLYIGARVIGRSVAQPFDGNPQGAAALGISRREIAVLERVAAGRSNKEIARELGVSPNTVKTHVARLFEKLGATRRTEAVAKARSLGIVR